MPRICRGIRGVQVIPTLIDLFLGDRTKDLIISCGCNVYPKEIEACLDEHDDVLESAVVARQDVDCGEVAGAYVVKTSDGLTEQGLRDYARDYLATFTVPKTIVFLEDLPRTTMGTVQKNQLRDRAAETA